MVGEKYCKMELYKGYSYKVIGHTVFNKKHLSKITGKRWGIDGRGYVRNFYEKLHQVVMGKKLGFETDHINRNKLDNRDLNLRFVTRAQNSWNKKYLGIHKHTQTNKWVVQIKANNKHYHIGCFGTKKEALSARKLAELKYRK